jgi:hypothetical protein
MNTAEQQEVNQKEYAAYKLGRRTDPFHNGYPAVGNGEIFKRCTLSVYDFEKKDNPFILEEQFVPRIGKCVWIQQRGFRDYVRTSQIQDYYIHDEPELSKDKIVLPYEHAKMIEGITWEKGDILLVTMNSLYYLKALNG